MSIVVFDPDRVDDVDWQDRMRHPMAEDPSNGMWLSDTEPSAIDAYQLRQERLAKVRAWLKASDYGGVILFDPYNQRYATGTRNMFGYFLRNSTRYIFIPAEGPITLFDYPQSYHVSTSLETIDEARPSKLVWSSVSNKDESTATPFAREIADLMRKQSPGNKKIGMDRSTHIQALALEAEGLEVRDIQGEILAVRAVKTPQEVKCLQVSMAGAEAAVAAVRDAIKPGISENELFAVMYGEVIRQGGEFIETRLLTSGQRTNPWFNEASGRKLRPGELVALDTDTIGCYGYYSDFSRTFRCGPGRPTDYQKMLYRMSYDQVQHNIGLIRPGITFREIADQAWKIPERFVDQRYTSVMHGVGMHGETPFIAHAIDFETYGREGHLVPGMVVSVESYIGEKGGREGVKLEEEVLVTETGGALISVSPFEDDLLGNPLMHAELTLDPKKTALLIVDLQEDQRSDPLCVAADLDKVLDRSARLLAAARSSGVAVFHAAFVRDFGIRPPRPFEPLAEDGGPIFSRRESPLVAICHEVAPTDGEVVLHKNDASAFEEGSLQSRLEARGIEWLVVAGVWTEACIAASVRDAMAGGFRVLIVKDACTSGTEAMHQTGVLNLANRLYGGAIADTARTEALLRGEPAKAWFNAMPVPFRFTLEDAPALYASL